MQRLIPQKYRTVDGGYSRLCIPSRCNMVTCAAGTLFVAVRYVLTYAAAPPRRSMRTVTVSIAAPL